MAGLEDLWQNFSLDGGNMGAFAEPSYSFGFDPSLNFHFADPGIQQLAAGYSFSDPEMTTAQLMQETMPGGVQEGQNYDLGGGGGRYDISGGEVRPLGDATPGAERFPGFNSNLASGASSALAKFLDALRRGTSLPRSAEEERGGGGLPTISAPKLDGPTAATIQRVATPGVPAPPPTVPTESPAPFRPMAVDAGGGLQRLMEQRPAPHGAPLDFPDTRRRLDADRQRGTLAALLENA